MNRSVIRMAADEFGVKIPAELIEADHLHKTVSEYRDSVHSEPEPDITGLTADNVTDLADALAAWESKPTRAKAADRLLGQATHQQAVAWDAAADELLEAFRKPFDTVAAKFTEALRTLGPAGAASADKAIEAGHAKAREALTSSAGDLATLIRVRDELAALRKATDLPATNRDHPTRIATFPHRGCFSRALPVRTGEHRRGSLPWLVALLSIPGVALKWQTPAEQTAHCASLPRDPEAEAYTEKVGA